MKRNILLTTALVVALTVAAFAVFAQGAGNARQGKAGMGQRNPGQMFERMDANNDGKLTKDEVPEQAWERIVKADADNDGAVTKEEMAKAFAGRQGQGQRNPGQMFERMDANNDGKLTKDEVPEQAWERIVKADENGDGAVTKEEMAKAFAGRQGQGQRNPGQMFERMDANNDGKLTKDEVPEQAWERIVKADADNDGAVTKEEMAKAFAGRQGQGQPRLGQINPAQAFQRMDANKDGKLTKDELPARAAEKMMQMDTDGNGSISEAEFAAGCQKREGKGTRGGQRNGAGQGTVI